MKAFEQNSFLAVVLRIFSKSIGSSGRNKHIIQELESTPSNVAQAGKFIAQLIADNEALAESLVKSLTKPDSVAGLGTFDVIRSIVLALKDDDERLNTVLEQSFATFADPLFIQHAPIIQQEMITQVLLLVSGYIQRDSPTLFKSYAKSSQQLNAVSVRLGSSSLRTRWLGMLVGTIISTMVDKGDTGLKFEDDSLDTTEAKWYKKLPKVNDKPAAKLEWNQVFKPKVEDIQRPKSVPSKAMVKSALFKSAKERHQGPLQKAPKMVQLIEEEDDLVPYAKPDSDPEDEDDDPTLVNRDKPKPPVYIRDLVAGLKESENYDRHFVALSTAASLIRRKAGFGKEVLDNLNDLLNTLVDMKDVFEIADFLQLQQEALIATLLTEPTEVAPYLARMVFEADLSLQQRTIVLTVLGLGARELAGYKDEERESTESFPSKMLPESLHKLYSDSPSSLARVSNRLEQSIVQPMALKAADDITGPNALKVRTFSSRMEVKKKTKVISNKLAKVVADAFFFPLTARWWTYGKLPAFSKYFIPTYLRTLAIILHASGPSTLSLPQMTSEFWDLLLAIRSTAITTKDYAVMEALLFSFLMILEINENKERLAQEYGKNVFETQETARIIMEKVGTGDEEAERIRGLAASVLVNCHEIIEKFQRAMVGDLASYS
jgi:telomere length regulation protein